MARTRLAELVRRASSGASAVVRQASATPAVRRPREDGARLEVLVLRTTALEEMEVAVGLLGDNSIVSDLEQEWIFGPVGTMTLRLYSLWVSEADHPRAAAALQRPASRNVAHAKEIA